MVYVRQRLSRVGKNHRIGNVCRLLCILLRGLSPRHEIGLGRWRDRLLGVWLHAKMDVGGRTINRSRNYWRLCIRYVQSTILSLSLAACGVFEQSSQAGARIGDSLNVSRASGTHRAARAGWCPAQNKRKMRHATEVEPIPLRCRIIDNEQDPCRGHGVHHAVG